MFTRQKTINKKFFIICATLVMLLSFEKTYLSAMPSFEERVENSGLNPDGITWRGETIRILPLPERENGDSWPVLCYRKDFQLPAPPRMANITVKPGVTVNYSISVNGVVIAPPLPGAHSGFRNFDITRFLRKGANVISFQGQSIDSSGVGLLVDGIVFCSDGSTKRILSDRTWKVGFNLAEGWDEIDADITGLSDVQSLGVRRWNYYYLAPPYYGPIQIELEDMREPIFDEEKPVKIGIKLLNVVKPENPTNVSQTEGYSYGVDFSDLTYEIIAGDTRERIEHGSVDLIPEGRFDLAGGLQCGPLPSGTYRIKLTTMNGTSVVEHRDYEIAVVGRIVQREVEGVDYVDGMELREVWSIDCAEDPDPDGFIISCPRTEPLHTVVKESSLGKYRTFSENVTYAGFSYKFEVENLFVPHLVTIEWPDDAHRRFLAQVFEPTTMIPNEYPFLRGHAKAGYQRADTAFFSTREHPAVSGKMRKDYMIYWPNEKNASIFINNADGNNTEAPAAVSRITVSEIVNDLPALKVMDAGDHLIGYHTERGPQSMSAAYHAAPLGAAFTTRMAGIDYPEFYRDWYVTTANMIKRMRFSGQNMYLMGHFMYNGVLYPSRHYIFSPNEYGGADAMRDHGGLILRMFERNDMKLISNIEYTSTREFSDFPTEDEIRAGAPTYLSVSRHGKTQAKGWLVWVNFHHPTVQESVLTIVDELIELYKDYPAWGGINFLLSRWFGGPIQFCWYSDKDDPMDWGYEDYTIELFQRDTGLQVPVDKGDPDRFSKRYDWLMNNAQTAWIDWRYSQYTALYRKIRDRLISARPDLKLYIVSMEPTFSYSYRPTKQALELAGRLDEPDVAHNVIKGFGIDLETLRKEPGMVVSYGYATAGGGATYADPRHDYQLLAHDEVWQGLFAGDAKGGAYIWSGMFHSGLNFQEGEWLFTRTLRRQGYPMGRFVNDTFVNVFIRSHPVWMPHTWMDVVDSGGRLHEMRQFARAYRSLPSGKYVRLSGGGLDKNIWIASLRREQEEFAYAANRHWWGLDEVVLEFAGDVKVHDLILDRPVDLQNGRWRFDLDPYEIKTFKITGGKGDATNLQGAKVVLSEPEADMADKQMRRQLEEARKVAVRADTRADELSEMPAWPFVSKLKKALMETDALVEYGDLAGAYDIAVLGALRQLPEIVVYQLLEAVPFLAIGPFGDPADTVGAGKNLNNPEVVEGFSGMETPYLGEFLENNVTLLKTGFKANPSETFQAYGNPEARWQPILKTDYLSFKDVCHSEYPLWMSCYAYTEVFSPVRQESRITVGSDHALWIWVNDKLVLRHGGHGVPRGGQRGAYLGQNRAAIVLQEGWNRILLKAVQRGEARVFFRLTDNNGNGLDNIKFRTH